MKETLLCALIGHLVGDYLLQTDWMALNKKKSSIACTVHCLMWLLSVGLFSGWVWTAPLWVAPFLYVTHYLQDRTGIILWWMKLPWKDQTQFATGPCSPWSIIVVDNVWHIVTIWAVWRVIG